VRLLDFLLRGRTLPQALADEARKLDEIGRRCPACGQLRGAERRDSGTPSADANGLQQREGDK